VSEIDSIIFGFMWIAEFINLAGQLQLRPLTDPEFKFLSIDKMYCDILVPVFYINRQVPVSFVISLSVFRFLLSNQYNSENI
jgi:hypothetical protein